MVSHTPPERERYEAQLKFTRDEHARLQYALDEGTRLGFDEGTRLGLAKGEIKGKAEGKAEGVRDLIQRIGSKRLGSPPVETATCLQAITSLDHLHVLADRILDCSTWDALLPTDSE